MDKMDCIRQRAYQMWQAEGGPEGQVDNHWQRAETELEGIETNTPTGPQDLAALTSNAGQRNGVALDTGKAEDTSDTVRAAGPSEMRDPPSQWSKADELSDKSFPASDPPGTY